MFKHLLPFSVILPFTIFIFGFNLQPAQAAVNQVLIQNQTCWNIFYETIANNKLTTIGLALSFIIFVIPAIILQVYANNKNISDSVINYIPIILYSLSLLFSIIIPIFTCKKPSEEKKEKELKQKIGE